MKVTVVEYDPNWKTEYLKEEQAIKGILQDDLANSFHIGSTSVPNLKAKPIIDILLVVNDIRKLDTYSAQFENLSYEVMGEFGIKGRGTSGKVEMIALIKFMLSSMIIFKK
ncbi:GrpB family protein [Paenibacillus dokdonensis]|nr:GrpB family protein [Paenibacillus dokdonensis]